MSDDVNFCGQFLIVELLHRVSYLTVELNFVIYKVFAFHKSIHNFKAESTDGWNSAAINITILIADSIKKTFTHRFER